MYGRTPSPEIMNHFSSLCLGVDQFIFRENGVVNRPQYFHKYPSVRPYQTFQNQMKVTAGLTIGLTAWITDDYCIVCDYFQTMLLFSCPY